MAPRPKTETLVEQGTVEFALDPKSDFESGQFSGIASVFGSVVDTFPNRSRFRKGAFLKTLNDRGNRVKILHQHDQGSIFIGLPVEMKEVDEGLFVHASLNETRLGQDCAAALKHAAALGKLDAVELSIGFDPVNVAMVEDEEEELFREITEARLWEISLVNFGADRKTKIMEAANLKRYNLEDALDTIQLLSETAPQLEHAARSLSEKQRSQLGANLDALQKLARPAEPQSRPGALTDYERWRREAEVDLETAEALL